MIEGLNNASSEAERKQMSTNLIATSPNLSGNVGSCKTEMTTTVLKKINFYKDDVVYVQTNSCTGEVKEYITWDYNGGGVFGGALIFCLVFSVVMLTCAWVFKWGD